MTGIQDQDTRYFVEIDRHSFKVLRAAFDQKQNLDKGRQNDPQIHRLFLTKGQYGKFVERCAPPMKRIPG
ncbi:MAG: hypothetical protein HKO64_01800 [Xanthomonadales bacterium]|nr:hypothetical protein [Xanthomonadales bacterium]NNL94334.1 hypothetical protein [Xanthomonadales bacterium]